MPPAVQACRCLVRTTPRSSTAGNALSLRDRASLVLYSLHRALRTRAEKRAVPDEQRSREVRAFTESKYPRDLVDKTPFATKVATLKRPRRRRVQEQGPSALGSKEQWLERDDVVGKTKKKTKDKTLGQVTEKQELKKRKREKNEKAKKKFKLDMKMRKNPGARQHETTGVNSNTRNERKKKGERPADAPREQEPRRAQRHYVLRFQQLRNAELRGRRARGTLVEAQFHWKKKQLRRQLAWDLLRKRLRTRAGLHRMYQQQLDRRWRRRQLEAEKEAQMERDRQEQPIREDLEKGATVLRRLELQSRYVALHHRKVWQDRFRARNGSDWDMQQVLLGGPDVLMKKRSGLPFSFPDAHRSRSGHSGEPANQSKQQVRPPVNIVAQSTRPLLLTLDAFDTLFTPRFPVATQYRATAQLFGVDVSEEDIKSAFKSAFAYMKEHHPNYGSWTGLDSQGWWYEIIARVFPQCPAHILPLLQEALYTRFSSALGYSMFADVADLLHIVGTGYSANDWAPARTMLGVVSNSDVRVDSILKSLAILPAYGLFPRRVAPTTRKNYNEPPTRARFSFFTLSQRAGAEKSIHDSTGRIWKASLAWAQQLLSRAGPHARMTRSGRELLSKMSQFHRMHVGDDLEKDVLAPMLVGWDAVWLRRDSEARIEEIEVDVPQSIQKRLRGVRDGKITVTAVNTLTALAEVITKERLEYSPRSQVSQRDPRPFKYLQVAAKSNGLPRKPSAMVQDQNQVIEELEAESAKLLATPWKELVYKKTVSRPGKPYRAGQPVPQGKRYKQQIRRRYTQIYKARLKKWRRIERINVWRARLWLKRDAKIRKMRRKWWRRSQERKSARHKMEGDQRIPRPRNTSRRRKKMAALERQAKAAQVK